MCGIVGMWSDGVIDPAVIERMATAIAYRGPDDHGVWVDEQAGLGLGHRRLSIIDLSPSGHQPMESPCGRYVLSYNGEIYNHAALRADLERDGVRAWRGRSDTETLLAGVVRWGLQETLRRSVGMFAFALWDRHDRRLRLVRDRMGEKPLYYGWSKGRLIFGSELKAFGAVPGFNPEVDPRALTLFLRYNCVPSPWSIHRHVFKLPPGSIVTLDASALSTPPDEPPTPGYRARGLACDAYWSLENAVHAGLGERIASEAEALAQLDKTLGDAIALQHVADVPVGAFLSGGIDSSLIVALMQRISSRPVRTFTIGFNEAGFNEAEYAAAIAGHLGTDHTEMYVTAAEAQQVIPDLADMYDEPFADSSQIPTYLVSRLARQQVTVSLSGDAGDELFGGYNRYIYSRRLRDRLMLLPLPIRRAIGHAIGATPGALWQWAGRAARIGMLGEKVGKVGRMLRADGGEDAIYESFVQEWHDGVPVIGDATMDAARSKFPVGLTFEERMMFWDTTGYLPDDILTKVDRAAMRNSLETRVPFLDHRVVELAWRIAPELKLRDGHGKWILRQLLYRHVPRHLIERPKAGFGVPIGHWLRGPLRDWAETLLDPGQLQQSGQFDVVAIRRRWHEHLTGRKDWTASLWSVLMYQAWQASDVQGGVSRALPA